MGKILRDYTPSEPKGLVDNRRPSGGGYSAPQVVEPGINAPRHSTQGSDKIQPSNSSKGEYHQWKVTMGIPVAESDPPTWNWNVVGGGVYSQGGGITVLDVAIVGGVGYAVLKITRDATSRELDTAEVIFEETVSTSTDLEQFRALAELDPDNVPHVVQLQFEEIRIWELMIVANGEFDMMGAEMSHRNTYAPP